MLAGCSEEYYHRSPVRNVAYNPYISTAYVHYNPQGDVGVVYQPPGQHSVESTTCTVRTVIRRDPVEGGNKEILPPER
jgi:hypothetical protein